MPDAITLTDLRIWDGTRVLDADAIRIERGRIHAIGQGVTLAAGSQTRSYAGATAMPGLIDAHVHMVLDPQQSSTPARDATPDLEQMRGRAQRMVQAGITTARDLGGGHWLEIELRNQIRRGEVPGPRLLCAGQPITSVGGHCHFWGGEAGDAAAACQVIERQVAQDVDLIKVMATGGRMTRGSSPLEPQFDTATLREIVVNSQSHGLPVAAHCHGTAGIRAAAAAGVDTIEHCSWVGPEGWGSDFSADVAAIIARQGVRVSPTINKGWRRMVGKPSGARMQAALQAMQTLEIPLIASTDAGIPGVFHHDLPAALEVFANIAGLSAEATLASATSISARSLGLAASTGTLATGLEADVLLLDGNPLEDLSAVTRPVGVWARGREVSGD